MRRLFLLTIVPLLIPSVSFAATLKLSPPSAAFTVGDTFTVSVLVSSTDQAMNAASGVLTFPSDLLSAVALSKSGSVMSLWVQEPSFSNAESTAHFEGVVLNPGYTGGNGVVMQITFRARAAGTAHLRITSGSVLANDGSGTEILSGTSGMDVTITSAVLTAPTPSVATAKKSPTPVATVAPAASPEPPTVSGVHDITTDDFFDIFGTTYPSALIEMTLVDRSGHSSLQSVQANASGGFHLVWSEHVTAGLYSFTLRTQTSNGAYSSSTPEAVFAVSPSLSERLGRFAIRNALLLIVLLLLIILSPLLIEKKRISHKIDDVQDHVRKEFDALKDMLAQELRALEKVRSKRALTVEEERFINRFGKVLDKSEQAIERDLRDVRS